MSTRLYLVNYSPVVSPAFDAGWQQTSGAGRWQMSPDKDSTSVASQVSSSENTATSPWDVLFLQAVSAPLDGAQTVSGTLKGQFRATEFATDADYRAQLLAKVVSRDGSSVTGTSLAFDTGALSSEFATTATNRQFPRGGAQTLTSVSANAGDRLVIEIGYRSHNSHTTGRLAQLYTRQDDTTDLPENETATAANNSWLEYSANLTFERPRTDVSLLAVQVAFNDDSPYGWGVIVR